MKRKIIVALLTLIPFGLAAKPSDDLMDKLRAIETYDASFKQVIKDEQDKMLQNSEGLLYVKRPGRFYWKSEYPDELLVVADGKVIWTYDIDLEQIIKQDQNSSMGASPAALLAGEVVDLDKEYDIVMLSPSQCKANIDNCYKLTPKDQQSQFKSIKIGFNNSRLAMIYMKDGLEQTISTDFSRVKMNQAIDDSLFNFIPPEGVDVIEGNA